MKKILFVLKSITLATGISTLIGIIFGFLWALKYPEHPHQLLPSWMIFGVLFFLCAFILSSLISVTLMLRGYTKVQLTSYVVVPLNLFILIIYMLSL